MAGTEAPRVHVITDSSADIPSETARRLGIRVVPLTVFFGDQPFRDGEEITTEQFYARMRAEGDVVPRTSQPSPADFAAAYRRVPPDSPIVVVTISSALSGTYQSARIACEEFPGRDITVVDGRVVAYLTGQAVVACAEKAAAGASREEVVATARDRLSRIGVVFTVATLEYFVKNGRIGKAQGFVGAMLNIKPLLSLENGLVVPVERVRGQRQALERMVALVQERLAGQPAEAFYIVDADNAADAAGVEARLRGLYPSVPVSHFALGPVVGCHAGPGTVGLAYLRAKPEPGG